jgi:hypothetical protein
MNAETLQSAADRYNSRAYEESWRSRFDQALGFQSEALRDLLADWEEKASAGLPRRSSFDARSLKPVLPNLCIAERIDEGDGRYWRWRLFGTKLVSILGEFTGKRLDEMLPDEHLKRWAFTYDLCLDSGQPMRIVSDFQINKMDHLSGETLVLPLANEEGEPRLIMAIAMVRMRETVGSVYD